jgi:NAD(P)-dependent dehydrogenase (short-subunit alcohol dehydrogenase family)
MWTTENIPGQTGKTAIVTGANSGIGYETALALYIHGAHVIIACRDAVKAKDTIEKIKQNEGRGTLEAGILNLANLSEIKTFADDIRKKHTHLHLLINNAGVMIPPQSKTDDGYELQFGVNFLGHFALTGHLYPLLKQTPQARVVTLSSGAYKFVEKIDFDNLRSEHSYDANREYAISKLADLQFMMELQRRAGDNIISTAAHPGVTETSLARHMPEDVYKAAMERFKELMPAWQGALPTLFAATSPLVKGGDYFGPDGEHELIGYPGPAELNNSARDEAAAIQLWEYAEKATGIHF